MWWGWRNWEGSEWSQPVVAMEITGFDGLRGLPLWTDWWETGQWWGRRYLLPILMWLPKSSWRPALSWWSSLLSTPSSRFLPWNQITEKLDNSSHLVNLMLTAALTYRVYTAENIAISSLIKIYDIFRNFGKFSKPQISIRNSVAICVFSGQAVKSYSQFTTIARHLISSKWALCA